VQYYYRVDEFTMRNRKKESLKQVRFKKNGEEATRNLREGGLLLFC